MFHFSLLFFESTKLTSWTGDAIEGKSCKILIQRNRDGSRVSLQTKDEIVWLRTLQKKFDKIKVAVDAGRFAWREWNCRVLQHRLHGSWNRLIIELFSSHQFSPSGGVFRHKATLLGKAHNTLVKIKVDIIVCSSMEKIRKMWKKESTSLQRLPQLFNWIPVSSRFVTSKNKGWKSYIRY